MSPQLTLFDDPPPRPNKYRLLVAILADDEAIQPICKLRDESGVRGKPRPPENLHITLHHIEDYPDVPERDVAKAVKACAIALTGMQSFEVTFDHVKTFNGRPGNLPFVLVSPNGNPALMELHRKLITELIKQQLATGGDFNFVPHVTMLYGEQEVPERPVHPVKWMVKKVVLILSHLGKSKYDHLEYWPLGE